MHVLCHAAAARTRPYPCGVFAFIVQENFIGLGFYNYYRNCSAVTRSHFPFKNVLNVRVTLQKLLKILSLVLVIKF